MTTFLHFVSLRMSFSCPPTIFQDVERGKGRMLVSKLDMVTALGMDLDSNSFSVTSNTLELFWVYILGKTWEDHVIEDQYKNQERKVS